MTIFLNGNYMPVEQAHISVLDRGFIFGDGVYEVIPVYDHKPFRLAEHLRRLQHSLDGILLPNPHSDSAWAGIIERIIRENEGTDQYLYLHITRGVAERDHAFPNPPVSPTVFVLSKILKTPPSELLRTGVACVSATDNRWLRCDIKSISLLPNVLLRQNAVVAGCAETILFREDAFLTEGAASNIFLVKDGKLLAPPKDHLMLPGITYDVLLEIAATHRIPCEIRRISKAEVYAADELLLTSSTKEVLPITHLDGQTIGSGIPGAIYQRLYQLYQEYKRDVMRT